MASTTDLTSPLLGLAPELRNNIYHLFLVGEDGMMLIDRQQILEHTSLLKTCHQVREEASAIFYAENTFHTTLTSYTGEVLLSWLHSLAPAHKRAITNFIITLKLRDLTLPVIEESLTAHLAPRSPKPFREVFQDALAEPMRPLVLGLFTAGLPPKSVRVKQWEGEEQETSLISSIAKDMEKPLVWTLQTWIATAQKALEEKSAASF